MEAPMMAAQSLPFHEQVANKERFEFGANWRKFLKHLDEHQVEEAERAIRRLLEVETLTGKTFLDIGSGSGLSSLAAYRLGATVRSFDFDPQSVACTRSLMQTYGNSSRWSVQEGSAIDHEYMTSLGTYDVVYSWGVLHHTGNMWRGMELAARAVAPGGKLLVALYNDCGTQSERWRVIKRTYNRLPRILRVPFALIVSAPDLTKSLLRNPKYANPRGMRRWHDMIDWVGGYPYEVCSPDEVLEFARMRDMILVRQRCRVGLGCAEYVLQRTR
jgi:2-polyprenyl-3-methyl-5-hydroxy-6-metoxy-1,4-benzoquinol methylase